MKIINFCPQCPAYLIDRDPCSKKEPHAHCIIRGNSYDIKDKPVPHCPIVAIRNKFHIIIGKEE
jgi:hypothetical protein